MTIKEAIETVSYELGEIPCISDEAYEALDFLEEHSDVVEPVRCRDCTMSYVDTFGQQIPMYDCPMYQEMDWLDGNDFCSYGKRLEVHTDA